MAGNQPGGRSRLRRSEKRRFEDAAELYLATCYENRTAARADEFAQCLAVTRPYLSRRAMKVIGLPLRDYLRERQLVYATRLLLAMPRSLPLEQIAEAAGFGSKETLIRCFKEAFGVTPGKYRDAPGTTGAGPRRDPLCTSRPALCVSRLRSADTRHRS